ncbi:DUF6752 domain-containing protein [Nocardioides solisilvae]|uniref:DUF6752 domain-containing protein n=1 Tax=Nocardioides solisilvae TaxID=1542435 RepID=UPI001EF6267C|nr:DUF6752 domain-containing protein [Nocardioides solisilvae]
MDAVRGTRIAELERRVADLEADLAEARQHHVRLAELTDLVQELLIPMADRDEERVRQAIARFTESL